MRKIALLIGTILALLFLTSEVSHAEDNVIHGCYKKNNGQLRVVGNPSECNPSEIPISWSIVGPQGPQGEEGPEGPQGEPGPINTEPASYSASIRYNGQPSEDDRYYFSDAVEINNTQEVITTWVPANYSHLRMFMFNRPGLYSISIKAKPSSNCGAVWDSIVVNVRTVLGNKYNDGHIQIDQEDLLTDLLLEYDRDERYDFHFKVKELESHIWEYPGYERFLAFNFEIIAMKGEEPACVNSWEAYLHIEYRGPIQLP